MEKYTNEQYKNDLMFIEKTDRFVSQKKILLAYFIPLSSCIAVHMMYFILFLRAGIDEMAVFNVFSILFYVSTLLLFKKVEDKNNLIYASIAEVIIHASLATICVGWTPDFGMFLLMLITMIFLMPNKNKKIPFVVMFACLILYGFLKLFYLDSENSVYHIDNTAFAKALYIVNIIIGVFILVYITIIYTFMNHYKECKLRVQNEQLRIMASIDPLTQLSNRREMRRNLTDVSNKSKATGNNYVIGIGDIDNFKRVNDTYGHDYGDIVLSSVASLISDNIPENGFAARWGGEEFLFVLPDVDIDKGLSYADKIIHMIGQQKFDKGEESFSVTMTIGLCEGMPDDNVECVISHADKRLYKGKHNGKNHAEITD